MPKTNLKLWKLDPESMVHELLKSDVVISIMNTLGRIIYVNDEFCKLSGYSKKELIGEFNSLFKSDKHSNPIYKDMWTTIKNGHIWKGVLSGLNKNGHLIWLDSTVVPIKNKNGKIEKFMAMHIDVTKSTENNFKIIDKEIKIRNFKKNIPKIVLSINQHGEILNINQGIKDLSINEIIGKSLYMFINPVFNTMVKDIVKLVFDQGTPSQYETMDVNSKGEQTFFISQIGPVINYKGIVVSATISTQEVTQINEINQELLDNEEKYRNIFQSINTGIIVVVDQLGKIVEWNKGAETAFGYTEFEIIGQPLTKLISEHNRKNDISKILDVVKSLNKLQTSPSVEMYALKKNDKEFPVEFVLSKFYRGKKRYYCAMMLDISNRKTLEKKLIQKSNDLELFLYRSAHDLKAPFSTAHGLLNLIKEENSIKGVKNILPLLETTLISAKTLSDDLLEASYIGAKNDKVEIIDFYNIMDNVLILLSKSLRFDEIKFNINIDNEFEFNSKPKLIRSLLQNLIQNAIKYSKPLHKKHEPFIDIKVNTFPDGVFIAICDNGLGIKEDSIDKIFDLYYRANTSKIPGSGLGLYIVKNIIDDLRGKIKVISNIKTGTSFEINLPNPIPI